VDLIIIATHGHSGVEHILFEIKILENNYQPSGNYELNIDGSGLNSGIYFISFNTGKFKEMKKIVFMK
jgi:hypothetical protein